jgi:regulator of sigma E protease
VLNFLVLQAILAFTIPGGAFFNALLYFVITIFILVTVHEFGHFITARIFGMHVPVFSVGMGQRVFGWNKIDGLTFGAIKPETEEQLGKNTDYRLSALPIGGYAKIDGMIDETQTSALSSEVKPWEFRAKPWWQKSIVISAGVLLNALLAWFIFSASTYVNGEDQIMERRIGYVTHGSLSEQVGVKPGDRIEAVNGKPVVADDWATIIRDRIATANLGRDFWVTVERNGQLVSVHYPSLGDRPLDTLGLEPTGAVNAPIGDVTAGMPAAKAGLVKGDRIIRINGDSIVSNGSLVDHIHASNGKPIAVEWMHDGQLRQATITPQIGKDGKAVIGFAVGEYKFTGSERHISYSFGGAIAKGWNELATNSQLLVKNIGMMITGQVSVKNSVGGPIKIAQMASQSASGGPEVFFGFMALLSISLAFLNILPIPALDGGHLLIIWIEAIVGHELSQRFKLGFQKIGVALLLSLMVFMVFNDVRNMF